MTVLEYGNKSFRVLNEYGFISSNSEVTFNDMTIDFNDATFEDLPLKYQEVKLKKDDTVLFTGYVDTIELSTLKMRKEKNRELTLTLLSPLELATVRTITLVGTYTKETAIRRVLEPLINDGFELKELNIETGQITTNFVLETVENAMNTICSKLNVFWYIDENKRIYVNSIDYLFGLNAALTIQETDNFSDMGLINIAPSIENVDYANVINFKNVRMYYDTSLEDYPIINTPKTVNNGDIVEFNYPVVIDEDTIKMLYEDSSVSSMDSTVSLWLGVGSSVLQVNNLEYDEQTNSYNISNSGSFSYSDDDGDEATFVLQRDSFFSNLITGFKWNGNDNSEIYLAESSSALRYTTAKIMFSQEIENLKGIISETGQIEKTIDYNEAWTTSNQLVAYGRSLLQQNSNEINSVELEFDKDPGLQIGDLVNLQLPSFYTEGDFAVKEIDYTYVTDLEQKWVITVKSADLVSTYIDLFRPTETEETEENVSTIILAEFVEEKIYEKHTVEVEDEDG